MNIKENKEGTIKITTLNQITIKIHKSFQYYNKLIHKRRRNANLLNLNIWYIILFSIILNNTSLINLKIHFSC